MMLLLISISYLIFHSHRKISTFLSIIYKLSILYNIFPISRWNGCMMCALSVTSACLASLALCPSWTAISRWW